MPGEIELSLVSIPLDLPVVTQGLKEFEASSSIRTHAVRYSWADAWSELVKVAIYKQGPAVSEVGSTWVTDLMAMNALHPFTKGEIDALGGSDVFLKPAWANSAAVGSDQVWSIPWTVDSRLLYYRRDLLAHAGIEEAAAFSTPEALDTTLARLKEAAIALTWVVPTHLTRMTLHNVASWVWGAGGDFLSEDGKRAIFDDANALKGFQQYYQLGRFLAPEARDLADTQSDAAYWQGRAAVTISGPWLMRDPNANPGVIANTGIAFPPGVPFVGGTNLVIWKEARRMRESLALVKFLTSERVQREYLMSVGLLPARLDVLSNPSPAHSQMIHSISQELQIGRSFRLTRLWGLVEDRLSTALSNLWVKVFEQAEGDTADLVSSELTSLARRVNITLSER